MVVTTRKVVLYMAYPKNPGRALSMQDRYAGCKDDPHTAGKNSRKAKGCRILLPAVRSCLCVAPIPEKKPTPQTREAEQALCSFGLQQICPVKKDRDAQGVALIVASLGVEEVEQILAWLEGGKTLAWYLYLFACVGVATGVPFIFLGLSGAQSADFHPVPPGEGIGYGIEKGIDDADGMGQRKVVFLGQQKIQVTLVHQYAAVVYRHKSHKGQACGRLLPLLFLKGE